MVISTSAARIPIYCRIRFDMAYPPKEIFIFAPGIGTHGGNTPDTMRQKCSQGIVPPAISASGA